MLKKFWKNEYTYDLEWNVINLLDCWLVGLLVFGGRQWNLDCKCSIVRKNEYYGKGKAEVVSEN